MEIEKLKGIVNEAFLVDLDIDNRKRETVDARKIYSKILRDSGYSYQAIGKTINKNHATIIHYIKNIEHLLSYDKVLYFKYLACKDVFFFKKDTDIAIKDKLLDEFFNYIEDYEKRTGRLPNSHECKHHILPLFNK
jgi:hypothetical protein